MPEFGKRSRTPYRRSAMPAQPVRRKRSQDGTTGPNSQSSRGWFKPILLGVIGGLALFAIIEMGSTSFLKVQLARHLQGESKKYFLNRDIITGVHHRKERLSWLEEEAQMSPEQRKAWGTADEAISTCFVELQEDRYDRNTSGEIDRSYYAKFSYEPALRDLGFYLPCLMREGRKRFCEVNLKQDLVIRINSYFGLLSNAKRQRERGPDRVADPRNDPFEQVRQTIFKKEGRATSVPLAMNFEPDERITDAMQELVTLGYLSEEDFSSFFGLFIPNHISTILAGTEKQNDECKG